MDAVFINFCEDEGLVLGNGIEYSFQLHLGEELKVNESCEN